MDAREVFVMDTINVLPFRLVSYYNVELTMIVLPIMECYSLESGVLQWEVA